MGKIIIAVLVAMTFASQAKAAKKTKTIAKKAKAEVGYQKCSNETTDVSIQPNPDRQNSDILPSVVQIIRKDGPTVTAQVGKKKNSPPKEAYYFSEQYDLKLKISAGGDATMKISGAGEQNLKCL